MLRHQLTFFSSEHDQELDSLLVGPIPVGVNKFIFEADPPNLRRIPTSEILGVTVILLTCSYDGREFVRVGYYVNNEYDSEELNAEPPAKPDIDRVRRNVLAEKPRVTRFAIKWYEHLRKAWCTYFHANTLRDTEESSPAEFPPEQPEADIVEDDGANYGAEEVELEEGLKAELAAAEAEKGEDEEMAGADDTAGTKEKDEDDSDAGSEDLEAESSGSDDEDAEEEEEEADADEDMEMGEGEHAEGSSAGKQQALHQQPGAVMVH